ncbi:single-stranded DNA-binding protein [Vagococcus fluvialis]|uniref:single-stranded DNA-binding protein n=1 Tax=Vagococcus fluvialis TaxID=2738 RepID=UPI003B5A4F4C
MINQVVLVGRLTKDADLRYTSGGQAVATFNLAVNRNFTNQSGEREADFINCVIWRKPAETLANYAKKGTLIGVVGRIQTRNYENQQGQKVYVTEVVCDNFQLLEPKKDNQQQNNQSFQQDSMPGMDKRGFNDNSDPFGSSSQIDISNDDLPF